MGNNGPTNATCVEAVRGKAFRELLVRRLVNTDINQKGVLLPHEENQADNTGAERSIDTVNAGRDFHDYSPLKVGSRFSTNARLPSAASFVSMRYEDMSFS